MRHEAPPPDLTCTICHSTPGTFRCKDCFGPHLLCVACCLSVHSKSPFHRIQMFNGQHFEHSDLNDLGCVIDLRHHTNECAPHNTNTDMCGESTADLSDKDIDNDDRNIDHSSAERIPVTSNLIFVSSTGIFKRWVKWCRCPNASKPYVQLLRAKLFPASFKRPSTAFTFDVLDHFRVDALECKTAAMNFMSKLVRITNEAFPADVPVSCLLTTLVLPSLAYVGSIP